MSLLRTLCISSAALLWGIAPATADGPKKLTFEDDIFPIFEARCLKCHGESQKKGNLDLRRKFSLLAGGDSGAGFVSGKPEESLLVEKIVEGEMPPKEEGKLDAKQIDLIKRWISEGAAISGTQEKPLEAADLDSTVSDSDRQFWSFQPPRRPDVPKVKNADRVRTPIDAFLLEKLEVKGLAFNRDADRLVMLRRLCFDLHGLPPTLEQIDAFLKDERADAYEKLVDDLLNSPRYGERWGRHWLDVAGFADSDGYLEADRERPEAWRYRDYVIRALNADKPYNRFLREQIAGDEMFDWRRAAELTPEMEEALIATGFLRTAVDGTYPGYKEKTECYKTMADTTQILSSAVLGLTLQCARCHAHKSDPFSQRDYYQLHAILMSSYDPDRWLASIERSIPLATESQQAAIAEHNKKVDERVAALNKQLADWQESHKAKLFAAKLPASWENIAEEFDQPALALAWTVKLDGTAESWKTTTESSRLAVQEIAGKPGYAIVRLVRPVSLAADFRAEFAFQWTSKDDGPQTNTAMQVVLLNFRDAAGNVVVSHGYVDENNNKRGSPVGGVNVGPDVIDHNLAKYKQAAPADKFAYALAAAGTAKVAIERDAAGKIISRFDDGAVQHEVSGDSKSLISSVEIELRRFVLTPGATFEGLSLDRLAVTAGPGSAVPAELREKIAAAISISPEKRNDEQKKLIAERGPSIPLDAAELGRHFPAFKPEVDRLTAAVAAENQTKKSIVQIRGLLDLDDKPRQARVLRRGDFNNFGANVEPALPAVLVPAKYEFKPVAGYKTTGRRTALADWIVDPQHPLTARVHVNRVWANHFGKGLVPTVDQFGHSGELPSHPELLDWLATEFTSPVTASGGLGWSQKKLHRLILLSTAYRQTSEHSAAKAEVDPGNTLLWAWRPRRHQGEVMRDTILALAGKLNLEMFGTPVQVGRQGDGQVVIEDSPAGNRRSIYLKVRRSQPVTFLELFDTPRMEVNCTERTEAIVATQALTLSNSRFVEVSAAAAAQRIVAVASADADRTDMAWKQIFCRLPTATERDAVVNFLTQATTESLGEKAATATPEQKQASSTAAWSQLLQTLLNSNEFLFVH